MLAVTMAFGLGQLHLPEPALVALAFLLQKSRVSASPSRFSDRALLVRSQLGSVKINRDRFSMEVNTTINGPQAVSVVRRLLNTPLSVIAPVLGWLLPGIQFESRF